MVHYVRACPYNWSHHPSSAGSLSNTSSGLPGCLAHRAPGALKAHSAGRQVHALRGASASLPLFRRATELEPEFAMAHASLGRIYADLDQSDLATASIERSWQLRDRASEAEKFFLTANYQ